MGDSKRTPAVKLIVTRIGSERHLTLIRQGYRTYHTDGNLGLTWMEPPVKNPAPKIKPHKWNPRSDPPSCIGCGQPFERGDLAVHDGCVSLHWKKSCFAQYAQDRKELGLD